nr:lupus la protein [Tanacetum cinerariifolium]
MSFQVAPLLLLRSECGRIGHVVAMGNAKGMVVRSRDTIQKKGHDSKKISSVQADSISLGDTKSKQSSEHHDDPPNEEVICTRSRDCHDVAVGIVITDLGSTDGTFHYEQKGISLDYQIKQYSQKD